uniref:Uncharacterized protein nip1 n=1 Tax=Coprinopsis cinerea TaxID=5346 RepID=Q7Z9I7_COPCI|nr:hypothetical protein [Coprinopsis cinerea]
MIGVWDWSQRKRLQVFLQREPSRHDHYFARSHQSRCWWHYSYWSVADGIVRLFRNYDPTVDQGPLQMVSAFRGLNEMIQMRQGSGMVMDWRQSAGTLLVGGDSRVIKVWDAQTETQGMDLDTNSDSPVTAICSDHVSNQTFIASFADGVVKIFDRRLEDEDAIVRTYVDHTSWVQNVRWHPRLGGRFLSASVDGQVKVWDLRGADMATKTWDIQAHGLSAVRCPPNILRIRYFVRRLTYAMEGPTRLGTYDDRRFTSLLSTPPPGSVHTPSGQCHPLIYPVLPLSFSILQKCSMVSANLTAPFV